MFKLQGILKDERIEEYPRSDGTTGRAKKVFIEPEGSIYPVQVSIANADTKVGKIGERVALSVRIYPFTLEKQDTGKSKRRKALMDVYIPQTK